MNKEDINKIEDILHFKEESIFDNGIWVISILALLMMNKPEEEKPIINIYLGDE